MIRVTDKMVSAACIEWAAQKQMQRQFPEKFIISKAIRATLIAAMRELAKETG
jgi:hypothetical protein